MISLPKDTEHFRLNYTLSAHSLPCHPTPSSVSVPPVSRSVLCTLFVSLCLVRAVCLTHSVCSLFHVYTLSLSVFVRLYLPSFCLSSLCPIPPPPLPRSLFLPFFVSLHFCLAPFLSSLSSLNFFLSLSSVHFFFSPLCQSAKVHLQLRYSIYD